MFENLINNLIKFNLKFYKIFHHLHVNDKLSILNQ